MIAACDNSKFVLPHQYRWCHPQAHDSIADSSVNEAKREREKEILFKCQYLNYSKV